VFSTGNIANGYGPNTVGGDQGSVILNIIGNRVPIGKVTLPNGIVVDQMKYLPPVDRNEAGKYTWNVSTKTWSHLSQPGTGLVGDRSNLGVDTSGSTYIESGKIEYGVNTFIAGYSKPFILCETPYQILYSIDFTYGEDLTPYKYTAQELKDYVMKGTPLQPKQMPRSFVTKFSDDVIREYDIANP
jgi:hypothetical protein